MAMLARPAKSPARGARTSRSGTKPAIISAAVGLGLGLLALGPGLQRGFLLSYDMVFVPREPFAAALPGLAPPRAVPSDLVIAAASRVLPADIVQKVVLLAIFVLACSGAAALLDREPLLARLAVGVFYTWNPYVAERLIIGQWALLLGYAGLPWVLRAVLAPDLTSRRGVVRLGLALLPAAVGGFAAMAITALVAVPAVVLSRGDNPACFAACGEPGSPRRGMSRNARRAAVTLAALAAGSLPWLIPSLLHPVYVDPASVAAFAARADTPFGSVGSLLMLGGAWNAQTVPKAYGGPWAVLWLAVVIVALAAYLLLARADAPAGGFGPAAADGKASTAAAGGRASRVVPPGQRRWPGLGVTAVAGLAIAGLGVTAIGRDLLRSMISAWPGFAVLRDAQQFVAPLALAEAIGFGLAVAAALNPVPFVRPNHPGPAGQTGLNSKRPVRAEAAGTVRSFRPARAKAAVTMPGLLKSERPARAEPAGTVSGLLKPQRPAHVAAAGTVLAVLALLAPVVLLPGLAWGAAGRLRPAWYPAAWLTVARSLDASPAPGSVLLLPWATYRVPSWNHGEVLLDPWTRLLSRPLIWNDGTQVGDVALAPDDPRARSLADAIAAGGPLTATLRAAGVRFVLDDADSAQVGTRLPGSVVIIHESGLTVYELPETLVSAG